VDTIIIEDLAVDYHIGVPEVERAKPQRLLLRIEMALDFQEAARSDDLSATINYSAVSRRLLSFGEGKSWKLLERLAEEIASMILEEYRPSRVLVEVKKFIIPQARHIAVRIERPRQPASGKVS
jgi:dihydroneopterin aldolase